MQHILGEEVFRTRISNYIKSHKYANAKQDDLWEALGNVTILDEQIHISQIMNTWTLQRGYPIVTVSRFDPNGIELNNIKLKQELFVIDKSKEEKAKSSSEWWIPITYTTTNENLNNTRPQMWLKPGVGPNKSTSLEKIDKDAALIVNIQPIGFYRVNYDGHNWKLLEQALKKLNHSGIHQNNREQILDDSFRLSEAGYLDYHTALNLTTYLKKETDYAPWSTAIRVMGSLSGILTGDENGLAYLTNYMIEQMMNIYQNLGFKSNKTERPSRKLLRKLIINSMCKLGHDPCVEMGKLRI